MRTDSYRPLREATAEVGELDEARISRVSSLFPIAEALLGAAHADAGGLEENERDVVRALLRELLHVDSLPLRLEQRIQAFDPSTVDVRKLAQELVRRPVVGRQTLIELTRAVCDSDGQVDLAEDRYM